MRSGPGERGEVAGEEAEQAEDAGDDPRIAHGGKQRGEVGEGDGADLAHAVREQRVADGGGEHDAEQHEIAAGGEGVGHGG